MRLSRPFHRLPVRFDVARLRQEVAALPADAWVSHPNGIGGNSALRLITAGGGENDDVDGVMQPTPHLLRSPYLRQVLASFGVVWSRSRLMKLAPHADVPEHADINYHWYYRVRVHIPVFTEPSVLFTCGGETVHMAAGEAWIFDNWRRHHVLNGSDADRIHLVADTTGSGPFWQFVGQGQVASPAEHRYDPGADGVIPLTERSRLAPVMAPAEVDLLLLDLRAELVAAENAEGRQRLGQYVALLDAFRRDWRQLYTLHGENAEGWPHYATLRRQFRAAARDCGDGLSMRTNRIDAHKVLEGRLLRALLPAVPDVQPAAGTGSGQAGPGSRTPMGPAAASPGARSGTVPVGALDGGRTGATQLIRPTRPVFIIAAPRSGSTLLFETLACSRNLVTLGGEAHWLVEDLESLRPGAPGVESNRLTEAHATPEVAAAICSTIASRLRDAEDRPAALTAASRLLEKTPKNALRIPFFNRLFPDAQFIFLWRDPRENLSSIIEAWRSGRWKTYNGLEGFEGPWSLLLPPGWQAMNGQPLERIAALQWATANRIALEDLQQLPRERWISLRYSQLVADPGFQTSRLCRFIGIERDASLIARTGGPLPLSRFTQTPPDRNKWRRNEALIESVLPLVEPVWRQLEALG
ncbi:MAG TPA: sulfotransferase [Steroidobacteraceae bacterium]|nr:sulfotransferase [Steroidobacteraceae bacterium]